MVEPRDLEFPPPSAPEGTDVADDPYRISCSLMTNVVHGSMRQIVDQTADRIRRARALDRDDVDSFMATFVERTYRRRDNDLAMDTTEAAGAFQGSPCVVLEGVPSSGRRTAAIALLRTLDLPISEVGADASAIDLAAVANRHDTAYLLHLPDETLSAQDDLAQQLIAHQDTLRRLGSYVVMVVGPRWAGRDEFAGGQVISVEQPDLLRILDAELTHRECLTSLQAVLDSPLASSLVQRSAVSDVVAFAARIEEAERATPEGVNREQVLALAMAETRQWQRELGNWFGDNGDVHSRLFLVSVAMLDGAPAELVMRAANLLAQRTQAPVTLDEGLASKGVRALSEEADAQVTSDRLAFRHHAYADSILNFVYQDRPGAFQQHLWAWATELPLQGNPSRTLADAIAQRLYRIAIGNQDLRFVRGVVDAWYAGPLKPVVVDLLTALAISPQTGSLMRAKLNEWAVERRDSKVWYAVADVCCGEFAGLYPDAALVRLSNLAGQNNAEISGRVVDGLLSLWGQPDQRSSVLSRIGIWIGEISGSRYELGCRLVIDLAERDREQAGLLQCVIDEPSCRPILAQIIATAFDGPDSAPAIREACLTWFDLCVVRPGITDDVVAIIGSIVKLGGPASRRLAFAQSLAHQWPDYGQVERIEARERIVRQICRFDPFLSSPTDEERDPDE
jgi:hypothetical protein